MGNTQRERKYVAANRFQILSTKGEVYLEVGVSNLRTDELDCTETLIMSYGATRGLRDLLNLFLSDVASSNDDEDTAITGKEAFMAGKPNEPRH